jgi:methylmalonyl-CoA carboxyltransferase large subunit
MSTQDKIKHLRELRKHLQAGGGAKRIARQHEQGKLTARERLVRLLDAETFQELFLFTKHRCHRFQMQDEELPADGVVTGLGSIAGQPVYVAAQDFTVGGGAVGEMHADKIVQTMAMALKSGAPLILINDSGGARIQEGVDALSGYGRIFYHHVLLSGVVPQIAIIAGPCAGGAAYSPALMDFIIMVKNTGKLFITGPQVIRQVTGEQVTEEELGGAFAQQAYSGVVHLIADNDDHAIALCQRLLSFLPPNNLQDPPDYGDGTLVFAPAPTLNTVIPDSDREAYDVRPIITQVVDDGDFFEIQENYAPNCLVGFARMNGRTIGIVANQPIVMAGSLDINASDKISRFVRFCNAFNIPLVTFVDVPGFMPGVQQEHGGIIRHGAKMLFAYSSATVPKITIILRKAYGGAYLAMCGKELGADRVAAWPTGEVAVMGAEGAVNIVYRNEIKQAADPDAARKEFIEQYHAEFANPYVSASRNLIDDVIEPQDTRRYLSFALEALRTKRDVRPAKKHGLIPM